jgi:selenium-binding protein 1
MMHVTYDGKRMYVTNSVSSTYDYGAENFWVRLIRIGPDGKMKMDPFFNVDFTNLPTGPARTHDMLLY